MNSSHSYEIRWHRMERYAKPSYRAERGGIVLGTVFQNFEGWAWACWLGAKPRDVEDTEEAARSALLAAAEAA